MAASSDGPEMIRGLAPGPSFPLKPSFVGLYHFERDGLRLLLPALLCQTSKRIWEESTSYYDCIYRRQQSSSTSYVLINTWQQTFCDCGLHTLVRVLGVPIWCPVGKYRFGGIGTWIPNNRSLLPNFNFESPSSTAARSKQQNASLTCRTSMADIFQARNLEEA